MHKFSQRRAAGAALTRRATKCPADVLVQYLEGARGSATPSARVIAALQ
jgi:hypothetical protein